MLRVSTTRTSSRGTMRSASHAPSSSADASYDAAADTCQLYDLADEEDASTPRSIHSERPSLVEEAVVNRRQRGESAESQRSGTSTVILEEDESLLPAASCNPVDEDEEAALVNLATPAPARLRVSAIFLVIGIGASWAAATEFSESAVSSCDAPFFIIFFSTAWQVLSFPVTFVLLHCTHWGKSDRAAWSWGKQVRIQWAQLVNNMQMEGLSPRQLRRYAVSFLFLWAGANYCYVSALKDASPAVVTSVFSITPALVYAFSIAILGSQLDCLKFTAIIGAVVGVLLFSMPQEDEQQHESEEDVERHLKGVMLTVAASLFAALYKVMLKWCLGDASLATVSLFLSFLGLLDVATLWVPVALLHVTGQQPLPGLAGIPWGQLCASAGLSLVFNFLVNFGIAYTYPVFVSVGTLLGVPIAAAIDVGLRDKGLRVRDVLGGIVIVVSFILLLVPPPSVLVYKSKAVKQPATHGLLS